MQAGISYSIAESPYTENFNTLPLSPTNTSLGATPSGWTDDNAAPGGGNFSIPGFHLWHPTSTGEGGANGRQRLRAGSGNSSTGAFYSYGVNSSSERALGMLNSAALTPDGDNAFIGLQLVNDTGVTLNSFTLTYNGKQFRSGDNSAETLAFGYSTTATDADWFNSASFTNVPALAFSAPVVTVAAATTSPASVVPITATTGFSWAPGAELWLRWSDTQLGAGKADDGLAIDDLQFSASTAAGPSLFVNSVMTGSASAPATWSNGQAPDALHSYRVVSGHTVTVDAPFAGSELRTLSGGTVNVNASGNGQAIPTLVIEAGGNLTETVSGAFTLGDATLLNDGSSPASLQGQLQTEQDLAFNADAGADVGLGLRISGAGNIDVNGNGAGSDLILSDASDHLGVIRFNGAGDQVRLVKDKAFGRVEMNSTGENAFIYAQIAQVQGGVLTFNENGKIDHASTVSGSRIAQPSVVNVTDSTVTVDLSKAFDTDERRFLIENTLQGSGAINVVGAAVDPTNLGSGGTNGITLNEFELGTQTEPPTLANNSFSGVLTAGNYVNLELRKNLRGAKLVVNDHAVLDMGHPVVESTKVYEYGDVEVNDGGTLEVGFEASIAGGEIGRHVAKLALVATDGRTGGLTLGNGSTTVMQINGASANQFDAITAAGSVALDGTLKIVVNPNAFTGTNSTYSPTLGDVFPLITSSGGSFPPADFNDSGAVDAADLAVWKGAFGASVAGDANNDGVTDGADFLIWQRDLGTSSGIAGSFDALVVEDPTNLMASFGLAFELQTTASAVNLVVVTAPGLAAVPEPSAALLAACGLVGAAIRRRRRES
ncbi:MAG: hypothetical protein C0485_09435 [Pirellula sp.]|nr:hypothetical protein [Pirellula sp.]